MKSKRPPHTIADPLVQAYVRLQCARANYNLKRSDEAMQELDEAIDLLRPRAGYDSAYKHCNALAHWMLGNLLLEMPDQHSAAVAAWQTSLDAFSNLVAWPAEFGAASSGNPDWYRDRCAEMRQGIERVVSAGTVRPPRRAATRPTPPAINPLQIADFHPVFRQHPHHLHRRADPGWWLCPQRHGPTHPRKPAAGTLAG